jgi:hypothetical protein
VEHKNLFLQILYFQNPEHVEMIPKFKSEKNSRKEKVIENFPRKISDMGKYHMDAIMVLEDGL